MSPTLQRLFVEYADSHRHPTNRLTHKIAIPMIVFHIIAMLDWVKLVILPVAGSRTGANSQVTTAITCSLSTSAIRSTNSTPRALAAHGLSVTTALPGQRASHPPATSSATVVASRSASATQGRSPARMRSSTAC